jgi:hypothetical protein
MVAVFEHRHIHVNDVPLLQLPVVRDAMTHHLIHRGTDGLGVAPIAQWGGVCPFGDNVLVCKRVQVIWGDAGCYAGADE